MALVLLGGLGYGAFSVFVKAVWVAGLVWPTSSVFGLWYVLGLTCAAYWPWRYRTQIGQEWPSVLKGLPFLALFGPLSLVLGLPM